jgi:hypothetical protein
VKARVGARWPYVCWLNRELGWYFCSFVGYVSVTVLAVLALSKYLSAFIAILLIFIIRTVPIPIVSKIYLVLRGWASLIVWKCVSRLFHLNIPEAIERAFQER